MFSNISRPKTSEPDENPFNDVEAAQRIACIVAASADLTTLSISSTVLGRSRSKIVRRICPIDLCEDSMMALAVGVCVEIRFLVKPHSSNMNCHSWPTNTDGFRRGISTEPSINKRLSILVGLRRLHLNDFDQVRHGVYHRQSSDLEFQSVDLVIPRPNQITMNFRPRRRRNNSRGQLTMSRRILLHASASMNVPWEFHRSEKCAPNRQIDGQTCGHTDRPLFSSREPEFCCERLTREEDTRGTQRNRCWVQCEDALNERDRND